MRLSYCNCPPNSSRAAQKQAEVQEDLGRGDPLMHEARYNTDELIN